MTNGLDEISRKANGWANRIYPRAVAPSAIDEVEEGKMYWRYDQDGKVIERCEYLLFNPGPYLQNGNLTMDFSEMQGFPGVVWLRFPIGLLQSDPVYQRILQQVQYEYHQGPWSFSFPVNPP